MKFINEFIEKLNSEYDLAMRGAELFHISCCGDVISFNGYVYERTNDFANRQRMYKRARQLRNEIIFLTKVRDELTIPALTIIARHNLDIDD